MKRISIWAIVLLFTASLVTACDGDGEISSSPDISTAETERAAPRIRFDAEYVSLGEATPDEQINYAFTFQNIGDASLIIDEVRKKTLKGC